MNLAHRWLCSSPRWKQTVAVRMPWVLEGLDLGANVLEIGPGYGATTDLLRGMVAHLTCVEVDRALAEGLGIGMSTDPRGRSDRRTRHRNLTCTGLVDCDITTSKQCCRNRNCHGGRIGKR